MNTIKSSCDEILKNCNDSTYIKVLNKLLLFSKVDKNHKDIFINLSDKGLNKLLKLIKHSSEEIRKLSLRLLLDLVSKTEILQNIFCEKFEFNPIGNVICLNWFPSVLKSFISLDMKFLNELKQNTNIASSLNTKQSYWMWPLNTKYNDEVLPDPSKYLIGFFVLSAKSKQVINETFVSSYDFRALNNKLETVNNSNNKDLLIKWASAGSGSESSRLESKTQKNNTMVSNITNKTGISIVDQSSSNNKIENLKSKSKVKATTLSIGHRKTKSAVTSSKVK